MSSSPSALELSDRSDPRAATILLVEDNPDDVLLVRRAFRKAQVHAALAVVDDGERAVAYLAGTAGYGDRDAHPLPALVLLDWKLPRRSGLEVLRWIRSQPSLATLPVVILTTSREQEDIERAYGAGANSYLQKPVLFEALTEIIGRLDLYWLRTNVASGDPRR